jgi:2-polyprenyl-3-methyl-5-hydroxy-6-metoxy-1,4-benzoquinol methylase
MRAKDLHAASLDERVQEEQRIWDPVRDAMLADRSLLQLTYPTYQAFFTAYPEYRWVYDFFGPSVDGKRILEVGCGSGVLSVALAASGAHVTAVDVSAGGLRVTRERAAFFGVGDRVETVQSPAETLELREQSYDLFIAKSVIHHVLIDVAMPRCYRFLRPGGRGAIIEPQSNPVLDFAREHLPYPNKDADGEHGTDEFFTRAMIERIIGHFDRGDWRAFRLLGMLEKFVVGSGRGFAARQVRERRVRRLRGVVDPIDERLFRWVPPLRRLAQLVVIRVARSG